MSLDINKTYGAILAAAREGRFVTYGELAAASGVEWKKARRPLPQQLGRLVEIAHARGWPLLSAIVVNKDQVEKGTLEGDALNGFLAAATMVGLTVDDPSDLLAVAAEGGLRMGQDGPRRLGAGGGDRAAVRRAAVRSVFHTGARCAARQWRRS